MIRFSEVFVRSITERQIDFYGKPNTRMSQQLLDNIPPPLHTAAPCLGTLMMKDVKPFSHRASLPLVFVHALLITFLALNMVMSLPTISF